MLVNCNQPYVLKVDNVGWSPIGTRDGKDEYVLTTGGFVAIFVENTRVFYFRNEITPDFEFGTNELNYYVDSTRVKSDSVNGTYLQKTFTRSDINKVLVAIYPTGGSSVLDGLAVSSSQGTVTEASGTERYKSWIVSAIDATEYFEFRIGNVLLSFVLPFEN